MAARGCACRLGTVENVSEPVVAPGVDRGWLRENRTKVALGVAAAEAVVAVFSAGLSRWSILLLAVLAVALWYWAGRNAQSSLLRDLCWIAVVSQSLALVAVVFSSFIGLFALLLALIFGALALALILNDRL